MRKSNLSLLLLSFAGCAGTPETEALELAAAATPGDKPIVEDWDGDRWTGGVINYVIDRNGNWPHHPDTCKNDGLVMNDAVEEAIEQGLAEYEALTPLRFHRFYRNNPPPLDRPYIIFRTNDGTKGSSAEIRGMPFDNQPNCVYIKPHDDADIDARRSVLHEVGHALGLAHEQQRRDREDFIDFDDFCIENDGKGKLFGIDGDARLLTPYDTTSIMHYQSDNSCSKTKEGCRNTDGDCLLPPMLKNDDPTCTPQCWPNCAKGVADCRWIFRPKHLSIHDVNGLTRMYERALDTDDPNDELGAAIASGDFDDDGYTDLAVGAPGEGRRGAVYLWKGTAGSAPGSLGRLVAWKVLRPGDAPGQTLPYSAGRFGAALAVGDFDDDGAQDLAVGAPAPDGGIDDGTVFIYESRVVPNAKRRTLYFKAVVNQVQLFGATGDPDDRFGQALTAGDFDNDGGADLAIGVPRKRVGGVRCGEVVVVFHDPARAAQVLTPGADCITGARFGAALASDHLDPDGNSLEDLAVGSPEGATDTARSGAVYLFSLVKGNFRRAQVLRPVRSPGAVRFGAALAIGNFDGSRTSLGKRERQLAIGAPDRTVVGSGDAFDVPEAGAVFLYRPASSAIDYVPVHRVDEAPAPAAGNHFGGVLAAWRRSDSANDVLVAGLPDAGAAGPAAGTGRVETYAFTSLTSSGQTAQTLVAPGATAGGDRLGAALATGNFLPAIFGGPGFVELVVGAPGATSAAGAFHVWNIGPTVSTWRTFRQSSAASE